MEKKLTEEQVRQIKNKLSSINLETERIQEHEIQIKKLSKEIQEILSSNE